MIHLPARFRPKLGYFGLGLIVAVLSGQVAAAQAIVLPMETASDLRGVLNVFHMFRRACLEQPVDRDLPARLAPEGYQVVSLEAHIWGEDTGAYKGNTFVLSKTGREQGDWDGGHPFVELSMPTEVTPHGRCTVRWKRAWDYDEPRADVALGLFGVLDAQVSFNLQAVLRSRPDPALILNRKSYAGTSDWFTWCWDGNFCSFRLIYDIDPGAGPETGIEMSISRMEVR